MIRKKAGALEVRSICTGPVPGTTPQTSLGNGGKVAPLVVPMVEA